MPGEESVVTTGEDQGGEQHEGTSEESTTPGMCGFIRGIHSSFSPLDS